MGVDAVLVFKIPGVKLSEEELDSLGYRLRAAYQDSIVRGGHYSSRGISEIDKDSFSIADAMSPEVGEETYYNVHLFDRYYGPGYERGHLPTIFSIIDFIQVVHPTAIFYYGADSDYHLDEVTTEFRKKLFEHFVQKVHFPYIGAFNIANTPPPECSFCRRKMVSNGWGPSGTTFYCPGCDERAFVSKEGEVTRTND